MKMKYYFGPDTARKLASQLGLDADEYAAWVGPRVDDLEIKARVGVFAHGLRDRLPGDYAAAISWIVDKLGPELAEGQGYFNHAFHLWPVSRFIEDYGVDDPATSLSAIEALTRAFTGEWAIRPFLSRYPDMTMERVHTWSHSASHNVRRLATEGIRPRLPWAPVHRPFTHDPTPIIPVLDRLFSDDSLYVRTSVANNINDISKTHPGLAINTVTRWMSSDASTDVTWVARRGLRGLVKAGDPAALAAVGYAPDDSVEVHRLSVPGTVHVGERMAVTATLVNTSDQARDVLVDYRLYFLKKNGTIRPTVFRLGNFTLAPGEERAVTKNHPMTVTGTRTYYPGDHAVSLMVNGTESSLAHFELMT